MRGAFYAQDPVAIIQVESDFAIGKAFFQLFIYGTGISFPADIGFKNFYLNLTYNFVDLFTDANLQSQHAEYVTPNGAKLIESGICVAES
jgi:hypothetical protein